MKRSIHIINWIFAISLIMAFNYFLPIGGAIIVLELLLFLTKRERFEKRTIVPAGIMAVMLVCGMLIHRYSAKMTFAIVACICALLLLIIDIRSSEKQKHRFLSVIGYAGLCLTAVCLVALVYNAVNPDSLMIMAQGGQGNYLADVQETHESVDGIEIFRDVTYVSEYPNNTYTVYNVPGSKGVFFYIHGGGLTVGDKEGETQNLYLNSMIDAGYSVVTVDYVLAPQNPFPESLYEVNDALAFFIHHCDEYGLNSDRIILGGDSAGGMLSGLLAVINTNPAYAAELGITPAVADTDVTLKGYISIAGLVDVPRFSNTGNVLIDWLFDTMGRCAFQNPDYACSEEAHLFSVLEHMTEDFPTSYLSDGNLGTFADQGKDLASRLSELGVTVETNFLDRSYGALFHTWELDTTTEQGAANFRKTVAFMDEMMK